MSISLDYFFGVIKTSMCIRTHTTECLQGNIGLRIIFSIADFPLPATENVKDFLQEIN